MLQIVSLINKDIVFAHSLELEGKFLMKTRSVIIVVTAVIFISFAISTLSSIISLSTLVEKSSMKEAELIVGTLESDITNSFSDSVSISQTINNTMIRDFINNRESYSYEEASESIGRYLEGLKYQFGYDTAFLVLENTKEYFTEYGRMKVLDLKGQDDIWYSDFVNSNKNMELNVDNDQANDNRITVYSNIRMTDSNGKLLGVCGVGHTLENLNSSIDLLEKKYNLSVMLADVNGIIQVAGDDSLNGTVVKPYFKDYIDNFETDGDYEYEKVGTGGYIIVKYIPEYNWYLCIESPERISEMTQTILFNLLAALVAMIIMVVIVSIAMKYQEGETLLFKADSETDLMTGLFNRRAFDNMLEELRSENRVRDITLVVLDINGLKQVNDEKGHAAGDELIIKTAECIKEMYENHGHSFRIGGDEFVLVLLEPIDDIVELVKQIKKRIGMCKLEQSDGISVSVGVARGEDHQDLNVDQLFVLADKAMYSDKEEYYKDKRHERRGR